jgi:prevent-host-death family protein
MPVSSAKVRQISLTELDSQTAEVVRIVHEQREPVALTRDGNRLAVVLSPEVFDRMQSAAERLRLQEGVDQAERELAAGEYVSDEDMTRQ